MADTSACLEQSIVESTYTYLLVQQWAKCYCLYSRQGYTKRMWASVLVHLHWNATSAFSFYFYLFKFKWSLSTLVFSLRCRNYLSPHFFFLLLPIRGHHSGSSISILLCPLSLPLSHQPLSCPPSPHPWTSFLVFLFTSWRGNMTTHAHWSCA